MPKPFMQATKPAIVIVEGPDGVGKSTLISEICRLYDKAKLISTKRQPGAPRPNQADFHKDLLQLQPGKLYMLDRHEQSNIAYERMRGNKVPAECFARLLDLYAAANVLCLYIIPNANACPYVNNEGYSDEHIKLDGLQYLKLIACYLAIATSEHFDGKCGVKVLDPYPNAAQIANELEIWHAKL